MRGDGSQAPSLRRAGARLRQVARRRLLCARDRVRRGRLPQDVPRGARVRVQPAERHAEAADPDAQRRDGADGYPPGRHRHDPQDRRDGAEQRRRQGLRLLQLPEDGNACAGLRACGFLCHGSRRLGCDLDYGEERCRTGLGYVRPEEAGESYTEGGHLSTTFIQTASYS